LRNAIRETRKLAIAYGDEESRRTQRTVWPIAMVYYVDVTLIGAWRSAERLGQELGRRAARRAGVLRDASFWALLRMRVSFAGVDDGPHAEEAAKAAVSKTYSAYPANQDFLPGL
jgi:hypothetical protein